MSPDERRLESIENLQEVIIRAGGTHPLTSKMVLVEAAMPFAAFERLCKNMDKTPATKTEVGNPDDVALGHKITYSYQGQDLLIGLIDTNRNAYIVQARKGLLIPKQ